MPDISLCSGNNCNLKENCYRYLATPNPYRQSYFSNPPLEEDGSCKFFWDNQRELTYDFKPYEPYEPFKDEDA